MTQDSIIKKIQGLRAKADNSAATEAEAMTAAAMAAKLMLKHDIEEAQLADKYNPQVVESGYRAGNKKCPHIINKIWQAVEKLTETRTYWDRHLGQIRIIGTEGDVEMALYLFEVICSASKRGWFRHSAPFMGSGQKIMNAKRFGYIEGFGGSVAAKLRELAEQRASNRTTVATGTEIVVVKGALIDEYLEQTNLGLVGSKNRKSSVQMDADALTAGGADGGKVNLNRPLNTGAQQGAIG